MMILPIVTIIIVIIHIIIIVIIIIAVIMVMMMMMMVVMIFLFFLISGADAHTHLRCADPNSVLPPPGTTFLLKSIENPVTPCKCLEVSWNPLGRKENHGKALKMTIIAGKWPMAQ